MGALTNHPFVTVNIIKSKIVKDIDFCNQLEILFDQQDIFSCSANNC